MGKLFIVVMMCVAVLCAETLSLPDCIEAALANNETVKIQELKVEEIKAKAWAKTASLLPYIGATAGYDHLRDNTDAYNAALVLTQPIFAGGRFWNDRELAKLELEQAELALKKVRQNLTFEVAAAYYRFWQAQEVLQANQKSRDNLREYYYKSRQLSAQTKLPRPEELLQIEVQLGNAEIAVNNADLAYGKALNALKNLVVAFPVTTYKDQPEQGIYESRLFEFTASPTLNAEIKNISAEDILAGNFEYQAALLTGRQNKTLYRIATNAYWPQINLQARTGIDWGDTFPKDETYYSQWGVSLQLLLFDFFGTPKQAEQSKKIFERTSLETESIIRNILIKSSDIYAALRTAAQKIDLTAQNLQRAQTSLSLYQERGQSYTANSKQLLDAEQAALQAETNQIDARLDYNLNVLELKRLLGEDL